MRNLLSQPLVVIIITFLIGCLCFSLFVSIFQLRSSAVKVAVLQADVEKQQQTASALENKLQKVQKPQAKEEIIRDQLLMQKPGEYVVQIPDLPAPSPTPDMNSASLSPWQAWREILF
jgi:cell division protein FtsB